jgi:hypothetical protein
MSNDGEVYPPNSITLEFIADRGTLEATVRYGAVGSYTSVLRGEPTAIDSLLRDLDLVGCDLVIDNLARARHRQPHVRQLTVANCRLTIAREATRIDADETAPLVVTTESLRWQLQRYREFRASWTDGEHIDLLLHINGALETFRMARATDGTVQLIHRAALSATDLFLMDIQDCEIADFFIDRLGAVLDGATTQERTGGNVTDLTIEAQSTAVSSFGSDPALISTAELHHELLRLRTFLNGDHELDH